METHTTTEYIDEEGNKVIQTEIEHVDGRKTVTTRTLTHQSGPAPSQQQMQRSAPPVYVNSQAQQPQPQSQPQTASSIPVKVVSQGSPHGQQQLMNWSTPAPDICYTCCKVYTTCQAANDFNAVAAHVGSSDRMDCMEVYGYRLSVGFCCWGCGGYCCNLKPRNEKLKVLYEQKYNMAHQENDCCLAWLAPELISEQVVKEHQARFGVTLTTMDRS